MRLAMVIETGQVSGQPMSPDAVTASRSVRPGAGQLGTHARSYVFWAGYVVVVTVLIVLAVDIYRIGFAYIDNFRTLERVNRTSWWELASDTANLGEIYRPLNLLLTKAVFEIRGADFFVYRTAHLVTLGVLFLGWLKACDPRTWLDVMRFAVATGCLLGLHTTRHLFHGIPLNPYTMTCAVALWVFVLARQPPGRASHVWPPLLTTVALLTLEVGLVVPVMLLMAYYVGWRGVSAAGLAAAALVTVVYIAARAALFSQLGSSPFYTETGFGFDVIDVPKQQQLFGAFPILFYGYNAASTLLTVLASEPRGGVFEFVDQVWQEGPGPAPWQWVNVITSLATSAFVAWAVGRITSRGRQEIAVACAGIVGNACLGFLYARDRIPSLAGVLYALCFYVSLAVIAERLARDRARVVRRVAALTVLVLATGWTLRCIATQFALRDAAWLNPLEWALRTVTVSEWSSDDEIAGAKLFQEMKKEALARSAPDPRADPRWTHEWLERDGALR
jgi:hypothetical protein